MKEESQKGFLVAAEKAAAIKEKVGFLNRRERRQRMKGTRVDVTADRKSRERQRMENLRKRVYRMANRPSVRDCVAAWPFGWTHTATIFPDKKQAYINKQNLKG